MRPASWLKPALLAVSDGLLCVYLGYRTIGATLLFHEGLLPPSAPAAWAASSLIALGIGSVLWSRLDRAPLWPRLPLDLGAFLLLAVVIPLRFVSRPSTKRFDTSYLPLEWHKLHYNFEMFYGLAPFLVWSVLAVFLALCLARERGRPRALVPSLLALFVVLIFAALFRMRMGPRVIAYVLVFSLPYLVALVASLKGWRRIFARATALGGIASILLVFYIGLVPLRNGPAKESSGFLEVLYPPEGESPEFTTAFFREMVLDREGKALVFSYGPTSGIVRFDLETRTLHLRNFQGLVRYLAPGPGDTIHGLDWINGDFLRIDARTLEVRKGDVFGGGVFTPIIFFESKGKLEIVSSARPGIVEHDLESLDRLRSFFFDEVGMTRFHSGAWPGDFDSDTKRLWFVLGVTDLRDLFSIVEFDTERFEVSRSVEIRAGGILLKYVKEKNVLLVPSFWTREISVIDLRTYEVTRVLPGPLTCRNLAYDPKRDLIYALGYSSGDLQVIRFGDGQRIATVPVGNKALSLLFVPEKDEIYVGSVAGILRIDIARMLDGKGVGS